MELPTVKPAKLKCSRDLLIEIALELAMKSNTKYLGCQRQVAWEKELFQISRLFQLFSLIVLFPVANSQIQLIVVLVQFPNMLKGTCVLSISCAAVRALPHQCIAFRQSSLKLHFWARLIFTMVSSCEIL